MTKVKIIETKAYKNSLWKLEKQKALKSLQGERKRLCPFCSSSTFIHLVKDEVEIIDDGETTRDELIQGISYELHCKKCGRDLDEEELK